MALLISLITYSGFGYQEVHKPQLQELEAKDRPVRCSSYDEPASGALFRQPEAGSQAY